MNSRRRIVPLVVDVPQAIYYSNSPGMLTGLGSKKSGGASLQPDSSDKTSLCYLLQRDDSCDGELSRRSNRMSIFRSSARPCRERTSIRCGAAFLTIPENYDEIDARYAFDPDLVRSTKETKEKCNLYA
jgi:hypothetical protein